MAVAKHCEKDGGKANEVKSHTVEQYVRVAAEQIFDGRDPILRVAFGVPFRS